MRRSERLSPVRMRRIAVVALAGRERDVLVALAQSGAVELSGPVGSGEGPAVEALRRLEGRAARAARTAPVLASGVPDIDQLERAEAKDVLAGEVELARRRASAVTHGRFVMFVGWVPCPAVAELAAQLGHLGASLVELRAPRAQQPPTLLRATPRVTPFRPLVSTYGAVPYADVDPTAFVAVTYCLMFGMMFGDAGDGLLIVLAALVLRRARHPRLQPLRRVWPMIAAAGAAAAAFGVLYGEAFGPTNLLPAVWVDPLDAPGRLLAAGIALGACLLSGGYVMGIINRRREGGALLALTSASAVPGLTLLIGGGVAVLGVTTHVPPLTIAGGAVAAVAFVAIVVGLAAEAGRGAAGLLQTAIAAFDSLLRLFSNVVSFVRLAAFGLMHAAIGQVVLKGAATLAGTVAGDLAAAGLFVLGSAAAFALEGLVVSVQALRLEYYELFSRVFAGEGRPFQPWSVPVLSTKEER